MGVIVYPRFDVFKSSLWITIIRLSSRVEDIVRLSVAPGTSGTGTLKTLMPQRDGPSATALAMCSLR
jgi:hypothetical protein